MAGNSWESILNEVKHNFLGTLAELDLSDYVGFCLGNKELRRITENYVRRFAKHKETNTKNSDAAIYLKNKGYDKYIDEKFEESLTHFTESIFYGPQDDEIVCLAYANRSAVLFQLGRFSECIQDIEMALTTGYDDSKTCKLILRKAECLAHLGDFETARKILTECAEIPHDKRTFQNVSNEVTKLECVEDLIDFKKPEFKLPELAGGENKNFVFASNYVGAFYSKSKGRHVRAIQDIEVGDVLFVEKPFTFVLLREACHNCCARTLAPIPCWDCLEVSYCSPTCRDEHWEKIHLHECGYYGAIKDLGIAYISLKIVLTAAYKFENLKKVLSGVWLYKFEEGPISWTSTGYESVYNLITHTEKYGVNDLFHFVMSAVLITLHMKKNTFYFPHTSTEEDLAMFASVIWRHMMQMICNCYAIVESFSQRAAGKLIMTSAEEQLGSAVYPSACIMNHSCEPSVVYSFYKNYYILRASKAIKKGEEIYSCYGAYAKYMKKSEREDVLTKQYFFKCECQHCLRNFDLQDIFTALKCSICKGPLISKVEYSMIMFCLNCEWITEVTPETVEKQNAMYYLLNEGDNFMAIDIKSALMKYLASWRLAREIFYKFHQDLVYAANQVAMCLAELRDFKKATMFLKCCLMAVEERFGSFSIKVAGESVKIGDVLFNCSLNCSTCDEEEKREKAREGVEWYDRAEKIYTLLYGTYYRGLDEIIQNKRKLESFCDEDVL